MSEYNPKAIDKVYEDIINKHGTASRAENDALLRKRPDVTEAEWIEIRNHIVMTNLAMAFKCANKFRYFSHILDYDDVRQIAIEGLTLHLDKFDPELGFALSTYVMTGLPRWIGKEISQRFTEIRLPVHISTRCTRVAQACAMLEGEGQLRTIHNIRHKLVQMEINDIANYDDRLIRQSLNIITGTVIKGDDQAFGTQEDGDFTKVYDTISFPNRDMEVLEAEIDAERLQKQLLPAQKLAMELRFQHDQSLEEMSQIAGTSRQNQDQKIRNALKKIRKKNGIAEPEESERSKTARARVARDVANGVVPFNGKRCYGR